MKKLTAGIFAGILTIVTVNAADAAIASKAYVDQQRDVVKALTETNKTDIAGLTQTVGGHTTDITNLKTDVEGNTTNISTLKGVVGENDQAGLRKEVADLKSTVGNLSGDGAGSVDNKIETAIGGLDGNVTGTGVVTEISQTDGVLTATLRKVAKADLDETLTSEIEGKMAKTAYDDATTMAADGTYAKKANTVGVNLTELDTQVKKNADDIVTANGKISANETSISNIDSKIGTVPADKTVVGLIDEAKTAAGTNLTDKLGELGGKTVAAALAEKQDMLDGENVVTDGTGNVITDVTAENGTVTVKKGMAMPEVPASAKGETGSFVLTATVKPDGTLEYYWEDITRKLAE